jgi:3-deoxy-D-manno-octulosonic-acid transferase
LAVVPRHPERFNAVFELMSGYAKEYGLTLARFSALDMSVAFEADMILVDAMGELNNIYAISDIAILGGAFNPNVGGHNPLEPAFFGCKIITGKHFFNQYELMKFVHHVQFVEPTEICDALTKSQEIPPSIVDEKIDLEIVMSEILKK